MDSDNRASYQVEFSPAARRETRRLADRDVRRIREAIRGLAETPRPVGSVKMTGFATVWRIRVGRFRIVYEINEEDRHLAVLRVALRNERTYRGL